MGGGLTWAASFYFDRDSTPEIPTVANEIRKKSRKAVTGFDLAPENSRLVLARPDTAISPTQCRGRPDGENNWRSVDLRVNAGSLGGSRQGKVHRLVDNDWESLADHVRDLPAENVSLEQKRGCIRPIANRGADGAASFRKIVRFDGGKGARPGNAG
jgi:hypothetical protein